MNKYLTYEAFGAKGDGKTNDFPAIVACHDEANKLGLPVKANDDATYYIGGNALTAIIKTDVDFGKAKFIIDDTAVEDRRLNIFCLKSDHEAFTPEISPLKKGQKHTDNPYGEKLFVRVFNSKEKIFIRKGLNMNNGTDTTDCFILDKNGDILSSIEWNYPEITSAYARRVDDLPISITGGIFTTVANQDESFYNYYGRGFRIERSNVSISSVTHYVKGEGDQGAPYGSFLHIDTAYNVSVSDCLLTPHFIYYTPSQVPGQLVPMGSYDINVNASIKISFLGIKQTVDICDKRYWGLYGSNFTKEISLENCIMSRYDAHQGVSGVNIKNCVFGHQGVNLIGYGEAVIENTEIFGGSFINLRSDYGSVWFGNITIKNCSLHPTHEGYRLITTYNPGDHDFGYNTKMADKIVIDGFTIFDDAYSVEPYVFTNYDSEANTEHPFPYTLPECIVIKNVKTSSGKVIKIASNEALFSGLNIIKD